MSKWYVLRVLSGKEKKAKEFLEKECNKNELLNKSVKNILLPVEKTFQIRKGKKYIKDKNFYPGYILIETEMNGDIQLSIENIPNIIGFLKNNDIPQTLKDDEVKRFLTKIDESKNINKYDFPFIIGEIINISDGPFASFKATINEINNEKKSIKATVKIFGRDTNIELGFNQVEKI